MRNWETSGVVEVIEAIKEHLPALYFTFSRMKSEQLAEELGKEWDFLWPEEKEAVGEIIAEAERENPGLFHDRRGNLRRLLFQGIGYHHAGVSPALKDLVERLYERRLIYVLFCTETFAVGINFPAASTVFDSCRKWDGHSHRPLLNREFFQMAGRAGRRGYDEVGHVYVRIDERFPEQTGFYSEDEVEPVKGRLVISPNTTLSLLHWKTEEEIKRYLNHNLAAYQGARELRELDREMREIDGKMSEVGGCFCGEKDSPVCPLYRRRLKRELRWLMRGRKRRKKPGVLARVAEIKSELTVTPRECQHRACSNAEAELARLKSRRELLERRRAVLQQQARDYEEEFERMCALLEKLGYIRGKELLPRGRFALHVHVQEILVTEMVFSGLLHDLPPAEVAAVLAGVDYQPGRDEVVLPGEFSMAGAAEIQAELLEMGVPEHLCVWSPLPGPLAHAWYQGATFEELLARCNLHEGDVFSILRREIDLLRQIERAAGEDVTLKKLAAHIRDALDRDEVAVNL